MVDNGNVFTLYSDEAKQNAIYPRTTFNAVSGANGQTWQQELDAKTNVSDIKDNLTSTDTNKPLSANQGNVIRKKLVSNLLKPTTQTTTHQGITFTNNENGTYTLSGTSTGFSVCDIDNLPVGTYKVCGHPGNAQVRYIVFSGSSVIAEINTASGYVVTIPSGAKLRMAVEQGITLSNVIIKPMICTDTSATYNDFVSYEDSFAYNKNGLNMDLLWTNSSPTSAFAPQNINLNLSKYKLFLVLIKISTQNANYASFLCNKNFRVLATAYDNITGRFNARNFIVTESYISFSAGLYVVEFGSDTSDNTKAIPYQIYGIK